MKIKTCLLAVLGFSLVGCSAARESTGVGGSSGIGMGVAKMAMGSGEMGPYINQCLIPTGSDGWSNERVQTTSEQPSPSDVGSFRTACDFSHMNFDDAIVYPGQPGLAHLHTYFGNVGVNSGTTAQSLATTGNSTCRGGIVNRSAYWVPALIDTRDGRPLKPNSSQFYYKQGYAGITAPNIHNLPAGLRMIAGDQTRTGPVPAWEAKARWKCVGGSTDGVFGQSVQNCAPGTELWQEIFFPQCWDGVNLDSANHKSHMAYPEGGSCPASHPVALPEITFNIVYPVTEQDAPLRWRLSSDHYPTTTPAGYSSHGDWFNGWKQDIADTWAQNCDRAQKDCHSHLLGDGRMIY